MPVAGRTAEEITARVGYFRHALERHLAGPAFVELGMTYHECMPEILTDVYFGITAAYKELYLKPSHRTDQIKQAAFVCATLAAVKPIRPPIQVDMSAIDRPEYIFANPMLGIKSGCSIVSHPFEKRPFDDRRRNYMALASLSLNCAAPVLAEAAAQNGKLTTEWNFTLNGQDEMALNLLVSQFSLYSQMTQAEQSNR